MIFKSNSKEIKSIDFGKTSYAQEGEDILISRILGKDVHHGFYVDVGAHHPFKISNTYYFYEKGWTGLNIDATPGSMFLFNKYRTKDVNIEALIGVGEEEVDFYEFNWSELNTFSSVTKDRFLLNPQIKLIKTVKMRPKALAQLLEENLQGSEITFMTIDVEGKDLDVLHSNDWNRYRPKLVLAEDLFQRIEGTINSPLNEFMKSIGYILICKTYNSTFFVEESFKFKSI